MVAASLASMPVANNGHRSRPWTAVLPSEVLLLITDGYVKASDKKVISIQGDKTCVLSLNSHSCHDPSLCRETDLPGPLSTISIRHAHGGSVQRGFGSPT